MQEPDFMLKVLLVGEMGVGKSSLLDRLSYPLKQFDPLIKPTIGMEFATHKVFVHHQKDPFEIFESKDNNSLLNSNDDNMCIYKLQIWDCAGSPKFYSVIKSYFRGSNIIVYTFDITNKQSFEYLTEWRREVLKHVQCKHINVLVGNKCDISKKREVSQSQAEIFAKELDATYIETSAKIGIKINNIVNDPTHKIDHLYHLGLYELERIIDERKNTLNISKMDIDEEEHVCGKCS